MLVFFVKNDVKKLECYIFVFWISLVVFTLLQKRMDMHRFRCLQKVLSEYIFDQHGMDTAVHGTLSEVNTIRYLFFFEK